MASVGEQHLAAEAAHGNPTLALPMRHGGGRVILRRDGDGDPIWVSHGIAAAQDSVRADVWNGTFAGDALHGAVVPAGVYHVEWQPAVGAAKTVARLSVPLHTVFDTAFKSAAGDPSQAHPDWEWRGAWNAAGSSQHVSRAERSAFQEAAMHGVFSATFEAPAELKFPVHFGMIARHYNAFHHVRLGVSFSEGVWTIRLSRLANEPPDATTSQTISEKVLPATPSFPLTLRWELNGERQAVFVNNAPAFTARDGYMGGVEVVGFFLGDERVNCTGASLKTTQPVIRHDIDRPTYRASIRPGNVDRIYLKSSDAPKQNLCWESGIQYGHIGGSEIKFTQGASQSLIDEGPAATTVTWQGPMPKFVERSDDVRGFARGLATFYPEHFVIADDVLVWTRRSVGPDIDLLGRLLSGPARVSIGGSAAFQDWQLPAQGKMHVIPPESSASIFPAAAAFPLRLGSDRWWLRTLVLLRSRHPGAAGTTSFAWQCPTGLTASHDFRCSPTQPGQEYRYTIVVSWQKGDDAIAVERGLLAWRDEWTRPMTLEATHGALVQYKPAEKECPPEANDFDGCFDRRTGRYVVSAEGGRVALRLKPAGIPRTQLVLSIRNADGRSVASCRLNDAELRESTDFVSQRLGSGELLICFRNTIDHDATLEVITQEKHP